MIEVLLGICYVLIVIGFCIYLGVNIIRFIFFLASKFRLLYLHVKFVCKQWYAGISNLSEAPWILRFILNWGIFKIYAKPVLDKTGIYPTIHYLSIKKIFGKCFDIDR